MTTPNTTTTTTASTTVDSVSKTPLATTPPTPIVPSHTESAPVSNTTSTTVVTDTSAPDTAVTPPQPPVAMPPTPTAPPAATTTLPQQQPQQQQNASLYVGDLHHDITESNLYEIFQALGPIQSIRVCRDVVTRRSLGYAYVNFHNNADAERALETMNYYSSPITKNKPLRMMWMIRDPSSRRSGAGNIFVKSLEKSIDNKTLFDTFSQFGNILSCKVATDDQGNSLGHGFVHFETQQAAQAAIDKVNGKLLAGRKVYVGKFLNKREREAAGHVNKIFTNIYVKNLDEESLVDEKIRDLFSQFGDITSIYIAQDEETNKPKGFVFVNYASPEMAKRAVEEMNDKEVAGKRLVVCPAQKKNAREAELRSKYEAMRQERIQKYQGVNLYVKNLSDDIDDERLRAEFTPFGTITSCVIMRDDKGNSRGFGFVCFTQPEEATKAVTELNGRMVGNKPIYVALHQRKEVRRAQLEAQRAMKQMHPGAMPAATGMYAAPTPYMYQQPMPNMGQMPAAAVQAGRNGAAYMGPQYVPALGRGSNAAGRGAGAPPVAQYIPMGRGQPGMMPGMNPAMQFGMAGQRQPRQNRQRGGPMAAAAMAAAAAANVGGAQVPNGNVAMVPGGRGNALARGRPAPNGPGAQAPQNVNAAAAAQQAPYKYAAATARGPNMGAVAGPGATPEAVGAQGVPEQAPAAATQPLTLEMLTNASPDEQKQVLGERLYPLVEELKPRLGGKITGMLLDMENTEIVHLLDSPEALRERVEEAVNVLREHAASASGPGA